MDAKLSIVNVRMLPVVVPLLFVTRVRSFITWPMRKGPRALPLGSAVWVWAKS